MQASTNMFAAFNNQGHVSDQQLNILDHGYGDLVDKDWIRINTVGDSAT